MSASTTFTPQAWLSLNNDELTDEIINESLASVHDDLWVVSACVDRILNDTAVQHTLLTLGLSRAERVVQRCTNIVALASPKANSNTLLSHFQSSPAGCATLPLAHCSPSPTGPAQHICGDGERIPKGTEMEVDDVIEEWRMTHGQIVALQPLPSPHRKLNIWRRRQYHSPTFSKTTCCGRLSTGYLRSVQCAPYSSEKA